MSHHIKNSSVSLTAFLVAFLNRSECCKPRFLLVSLFILSSFRDVSLGCLNAAVSANRAPF